MRKLDPRRARKSIVGLAALGALWLAAAAPYYQGTCLHIIHV
jgi:hypothetical protein